MNNYGKSWMVLHTSHSTKEPGEDFSERLMVLAQNNQEHQTTMVAWIRALIGRIGAGLTLRRITLPPGS